MTQEQTDWHHLFGLMVKDFFTGSACEVELERDLSVKSQFLDVLIVRKTAAALDLTLPDGLEGNLVEHNLITFKSHREALDDWSLDELIGHYVNYRKQVSPDFDHLLPKPLFRLFAVTARFPASLAAGVALAEVQQGVFDVTWGTTPIRIVVAGRLPASEPNALLHLFSASEKLVQYGQQHCRIRSAQTSTLVLDLFAGYRVEGLTVPITMDEYIRQATRRAIQSASIEDRLEGLTSQQLLKDVPPEERLKGLPPEERLKGLTAEDREKLLRLLTEPPTA